MTDDGDTDREGAFGVPRTLEQMVELRSTRPEGWELLLFAGVLLRCKNELELRWRDHQLKLPTADFRRVDDDEVAGLVGDAFDQLGWIIGPLERVFAAQEDAFGKPGEAGDPELITHFAEWIVGVYERLLAWAGTIRSASVPEEFELAVDLCSQSADLPIKQIRSFIDDTVAATDELPKKLAMPPEGRDPIELDLALTLRADHELMEAAVDELRRVLEHFGD